MSLPYGFARITFYSGKSVSVWFLPLNASSNFQQATTLFLLPLSIWCYCVECGD